MDYKRIALLLEDQLKLAAQREEELLKVIAAQYPDCGSQILKQFHPLVGESPVGKECIP